MSKSDYIPDKDSELVAWSANFTAFIRKINTLSVSKSCNISEQSDSQSDGEGYYFHFHKTLF